MKKLENFARCLEVLKEADFEAPFENEIYRMGVICQFSFTLELAWKALREVMLLHGAETRTGSPREIIQLGYKIGFINDSAVWLVMLKQRNFAAHVYDEDQADKLVLLIRDSFISAFSELEKTLREKLAAADV